MSWLAAGVVYSLAYVAVGWGLHGYPTALLWFRGVALLVPPTAGVAVIVRRRRQWAGCQWLFWATIALGLTMSAVGLVGWTVDELLLAHETSWLGWYSVFSLFGGAAPLLALLAQPHRGSREGVTASTAVDIAGIAVMTGFLYSHFVVGPGLIPLGSRAPSLSLLLLSEFQQVVALAGMTTAAVVARGGPWAPTYRRLTLGLFVQFVILSISSLEILQGLYRSGFLYDLVWILPFAFFPWAAEAAPASSAADVNDDGAGETPSRPWIVFGALGLTPVLDYGLRQVLPLGPLEPFRDLFMVITVFSVLPLLLARLVVERGEARAADRRRRLLATAIEQADDQIAILTLDGRIEHANPAFGRALGYEAAELAGVAEADLLAPPSREQIGVVLEAARTGGAWRGTLVRRRRDGSTYLASSAMVGMREGAGSPGHLVSVERDVTNEQRLREQLIHSERLAAVGQLVSGVAHELNNPLQSIIGFTELLMDGERREQQRLDLEQVRSEAGRAARIVHNLLSFVRRSSSQRHVSDVNDLVRGTVDLRHYHFATANIDLRVDYGEDLPAVMVNREEIQQILLNLFLNAEQAIAAAGVAGRLWVRTAAADAGVVIDVHDNGPGVPSALVGQIFEPFFSTKEIGQGTGLGLSIALGIAESHGGRLELVSTGPGACFRLTLPPTEVSQPVAAAARTHCWADMTGRHALVADDEAGLRGLLQRLLTRRGFAVEVACDGAEAADLLGRGRYDVIFCDAKMPALTGADLYEMIRRRQPHLLDAFVFMSGDVVDPTLQRLVTASRTPFLPKPFTTEQLDAALTRVLSQRVH